MIALGIIILALGGYLVYALIYPEHWESSFWHLAAIWYMR